MSGNNQCRRKESKGFKMSSEIENIKKELKEQNKFLHSMLKSIEDIKKGKVKKFKFSKKSDL